MRSQVLTEIRAREAYSPRWLLVPLVPVVVVIAAWLLTVRPRDADPTPVLVDSMEATVIEQHGA